MQNFSIHTHTIGFDGKNSVSQMLEAAQKAGLKRLGISNHFIVYPTIKDTKMYDAALQRGYQNIYSATFDEAYQIAKDCGIKQFYDPLGFVRSGAYIQNQY